MRGMNNGILRGEIYLDTDFGGGMGSEQMGRRPCIVVSNNVCNRFSPVVTVVPITKQLKNNIPTHFTMPRQLFNLAEDSTALVEQLRTIDKRRLGRRHNVALTPYQMCCVSELIKIQTGI